METELENLCLKKRNLRQNAGGKNCQADNRNISVKLTSFFTKENN